jgi:hypothetical protein
MRLARFASCGIALVLLVAGLCAAGDRPAKQQKAVLLTSLGDSRYPTWKVTAYGETAEKADEQALEKARVVVCDYLRDQDPPVHWRPDARWVDDNLVKSRTPAEQKDFQEAGLGKAWERTLQVEVGAKQYREILEHDRQVSMEQRQLLLARILAGVVALLVAAVGYLRLDEATKGYYTLWLRLGALALVGAVAALLFVVVRA